MRLTPNFELSEFSCDGREPPPELRPNAILLAEQLQYLRDHLLRPVRVTSGWRTPEKNEAVNGAPGSHHLTCMAADIQVDGMTPEQLHSKVLELMADGMMRDGGLGLYPTHVHYDIGPRGRRWGHAQ